MFKKILFSLIFVLSIFSCSITMAAGPDLDNTALLGLTDKPNVATDITTSTGMIDKINNTASVFSRKNAVTLFNNGIVIVLGFFATITLFIIIYSGFKVIASNGKVDSYQEGVKLLRTAIIAMIIILMSYGISKFVINSIKYVSENSFGSGNGVACTSNSECTGQDQYCCLSGSFFGCTVNTCNTLQDGTDQCNCPAGNGSCIGVCRKNASGPTISGFCGNVAGWQCYVKP